jgi:S-formylglutathione hydrolase FrmB
LTARARLIRRRSTLLAAVLALGVIASSVGCGNETSDELTPVSERASGPRMRAYTFESPALGSRTNVRVLLPRDYGSSERRYPVLYLLHGAGADAGFWPAAGIRSIVGDQPLIVVMPDGDTGFYSDPHNDGALGPPRWETYHLDELIPWVDSELRTRADPSGRAVAGVSMGGIGALLYATRRPHLFAFAGSISGPVQVEPGPMARVLLATGRDPALLEPIWGPYPQEAERWRRHNPIALAPELRDVDLVLSTGNGRPTGGRGEFSPLEAEIARMNRALHRRLLQLGIPHRWDVGPGVHDVPDWQEALATILPGMIGALRMGSAAAVAQ